MNKIRFVALLVIAMFAFSSSLTFAQSSPGNTQMEKSWREKKEAAWQELSKELGLNDAQKKLLDENKAKHREQMKQLFAEMKDKRTEMRKELQNDQLNMARIKQINGELKRLQVQMLDCRLEHILAVRKILTAEQFKKFTDKMEERMKHSKDKHEGS